MDLVSKYRILHSFQISLVFVPFYCIAVERAEYRGIKSTCVPREVSPLDKCLQDAV